MELSRHSWTPARRLWRHSVVWSQHLFWVHEHPHPVIKSRFASDWCEMFYDQNLGTMTPPKIYIINRPAMFVCLFVCLFVSVSVKNNEKRCHYYTCYCYQKLTIMETIKYPLPPKRYHCYLLGTVYQQTIEHPPPPKRYHCHLLGAVYSTLLTGQRCLSACLPVCVFVCLSVKKIWDKIPRSVCHPEARKDTDYQEYF